MAAIAEKIRKSMVSAMADYSMVVPEDRVLVAVSGGKDSTIMLLLLDEIRRRAEFSFSIQGVILDQKQPGFRAETYMQWLADRGLSVDIIEEDTYSIVKEKVGVGKTYCGLCSRLRRGILYNYAHDHGFTKIALGHHRDDVNETTLLNMFYTGSLATMPPKLISDDQRNVVIRPLVYVAERDLADYAALLEIPVIPCNLCGSQEKLKRKKIKALLSDLEVENPNIGASMLAALGNIKKSQLLDRSLHDFSNF